METIQTVNLHNNLSLISAGASSVDLVVASNWEGDPRATILSDGMPVIVLQLDDPDGPGEWSWVSGLHTTDIFAREFRQATISLGELIGEVSESQSERWSNDIGGPFEVETWLDIMSDGASEGHALLALVDRCMEVLRTRFA